MELLWLKFVCRRTWSNWELKKTSHLLEVCFWELFFGKFRMSVFSRCLFWRNFPSKFTRRIILETMNCRLKFQCHREHFIPCWNTSTGPICKFYHLLSPHGLFYPLGSNLRGCQRFLFCVSNSPRIQIDVEKIGEMCGGEENWVCRFVGALAWDDLCNVSLSSSVIRRTARYYFQRRRTVYGKFLVKL